MASLLADYRATYVAEIARHAVSILGGGKLATWLLAPVRSTHARRRNFFRGALLVRSARAGGHAAAAPALAACAEVGWTCALVLDDILDRSNEREGAVAAHVEYGALRSTLAVAAALLRIAWKLAWGIPEASASTRLSWVLLGIRLVLRASRAAVLPDATSLNSYRAIARDVNCSLEWALISPHCGTRDAVLRGALRRFVSHSAVAGRMKNDLADYWGGSSERDGRFEDFGRRRMSLPVLVLLRMPLASADRNAVLAHFHARSPLAAKDLLALFGRHGVLERCVELLETEARDAEEALRLLVDLPGGPPLSAELAAWNRVMVQSCRALLSAHS